ncbi:glycosyltransferase involved in cell wall biosynthesis [Methylohalomonas lacus]|uniref:Glycosyltransferase involved in cell wall biosynthesis n=1 Tax=Methylohalomonas lacus TaxID=398773 RepID=A0AAE3HN69_9GAMM|nr:glycosyltransferase [Methylohalomonas lacus]MCS3904321.1 glycosyltransferase involved in cell wall biosynthesis [Methylohalomonas lacus]
MKIMYLMDAYRDPYAGTEQQLYNLIDGLDRSRFTPALTLFRPSAHIDQYGFPCPVEVLNIRRMFSPRTLITMIRFALALRREHYRLVHIFFNDASILAPVFLKIFGIRVVISRRDMGFWYTPGKLAILRGNRFFIDRVIANSEAVKRVTHDKERVPLEKIQVIYNGHAQPATNPVDDSALENSSYLKNGEKVIGIVANIRPVKRIDDLIRAFGLLRRNRTDVKLVIVGSGDTGPLQELARELDLADHVHFTGAKTDIPPIIRQFDVGVLCSESEGLSNAIIEYMQCGVPVVCTDTGGNRELVQDGETGYRVPVGDIDMLAGKIGQLLEEPDRAAIMAHRAAARVAELCNMQSMLSRHAALYAGLADSRVNAGDKKTCPSE